MEMNTISKILTIFFGPIFFTILKGIVAIMRIDMQ